MNAERLILEPSNSPLFQAVNSSEIPSWLEDELIPIERRVIDLYKDGELVERFLEIREKAAESGSAK